MVCAPAAATGGEGREGGGRDGGLGRGEGGCCRAGRGGSSVVIGQCQAGTEAERGRRRRLGEHSRPGNKMFSRLRPPDFASRITGSYRYFSTSAEQFQLLEV